MITKDEREYEKTHPCNHPLGRRGTMFNVIKCLVYEKIYPCNLSIRKVNEDAYKREN